MIDLASALEGELKSLNASTITNIFIFLIIILFVTSLIFAIQDKGKRFTSNTAGLLTSFGILGTFIGIVIGLLEFDPKHIDESIQLLLEGLKTAFITSLVGMSAAISYKLIETTPIISSKKKTSKKTNASPKDILNAILKQNHSLEELKETLSNDSKLNLANQENQHKLAKKQTLLMVHQNNNLIKLKNSLISEEEEGNLIGQIKLINENINHHHQSQQQNFKEFSEELWENLREFSEILSRYATEQVIETLKEAISSFNKNLTEQFGENFKALDSSVKKLVDWQAKYGEQLEQMISLYDKSSKAIAEMEKSIASINKETQAIPEAMGKLQSVIDVNQKKMHEQASKTIESIAQTAKEVSNGFQNTQKEHQSLMVANQNEFQEQTSTTIESMARSAKEASDGYQNTQKEHQSLMVANQNEFQEQTSVTIESIVLAAKEASDGYNKLLSETDNLQKSFELSTTQLLKQQAEAMSDSMALLEDEIRRVITLTGVNVDTQLSRIDESVTREVNRVMTEMGQALASISGQFTQDYQKLTKKMKKITTMAEA